MEGEKKLTALAKLMSEVAEMQAKIEGRRKFWDFSFSNKREHKEKNTQFFVELLGVQSKTQLQLSNKNPCEKHREAKKQTNHAGRLLCGENCDLPLSRTKPQVHSKDMIFDSHST